MTLYDIPWCSSPDDFDDLWQDEADEIQLVPDMLCTMFAQQEKHMRTYSEISRNFLPPEKWGLISDPQTQDALRENYGYIGLELAEAVSELKNKPWCRTQRDTDNEKFREELADVWHFLIQFHILAGHTPEKVFEEYFRKALINRARQEGDY